MPGLDVINIKGEKVGEVEIPDSLLRMPGSEGMIYDVVRMHQANRRRGTASTKNRAEVSYSGRKPWRQKGTGRARAGERGSPIWRGGGVIFGPRPRDFSFTVPRQVKRKALKAALVIRFQKSQVIILDELTLQEPKTGVLARILDDIGAGGSALILTTQPDAVLRLAAANLPGIEAVGIRGLNAYCVISHKKLLLTREALEHLRVWMEKVG